VISLLLASACFLLTHLDAVYVLIFALHGGVVGVPLT